MDTAVDAALARRLLAHAKTSGEEASLQSALDVVGSLVWSDRAAEATALAEEALAVLDGGSFTVVARVRAWVALADAAAWSGRSEMAASAMAQAVDLARCPSARPHRARAGLGSGLATELGVRRAHRLSSQALGGPVEAAASRPCGLTPREVEVLSHVAEGCTNRDIAARMFLSVKTVERHLLNAYTKAGLRNRSEATAFVLRRGLAV